MPHFLSTFAATEGDRTLSVDQPAYAVAEGFEYRIYARPRGRELDSDSGASVGKSSRAPQATPPSPPQREERKGEHEQIRSRRRRSRIFSWEQRLASFALAQRRKPAHPRRAAPSNNNQPPPSPLRHPSEEAGTDEPMYIISEAPQRRRGMRRCDDRVRGRKAKPRSSSPPPRPRPAHPLPRSRPDSHRICRVGAESGGSLLRAAIDVAGPNQRAAANLAKKTSPSLQLYKTTRRHRRPPSHRRARGPRGRGITSANAGKLIASLVAFFL